MNLSRVAAAFVAAAAIVSGCSSAPAAAPPGQGMQPRPVGLAEARAVPLEETTEESWDRVLAVNVTLLSCYAFGCHSFRHIIGGFRDELAGAPVQKRAYDCVSCLNRRHQTWAWCSLFSVAFADLYVRMCSMGIWTDWRIL